MSQTGPAMGAWRKSIRCESQQCVEVALVNGRMAIRNSTDPDRYVMVEAEAWRDFMTALRTGDWNNR